MLMPLDLNNLTFGAELELYHPLNASKQACASAVARRIGKPVEVQGYNHSTSQHWKVVTDGSLGDTVRGCEFVSPVLRGLDGLAELAAVCEALSDYGCTVSRSCGFHVHIGVAAVNGITLQHIKNLVRIYQAYETIIDGMMPPSRRGSDNVYCRSLANAQLAQITAANSVAQLFAAVSGSQRYCKLNLGSFARYGTVEFRQHSGTLEARKAVMWTKHCMRMVLAATEWRDFTVVSDGLAQQINKARPGSKAHLVGEMMLRPEGATPAQVMAATGWPSVSMPNQARQAGLEVTRQRRGRHVIYFARRDVAQAPTSFVRTLQGYTTLLKMEPDEIAYFRTRTENLSGPVAWTA